MQLKPDHNWAVEEESGGLSGDREHTYKIVLSSYAIGLLANSSVSPSWQAFSRLTEENMKLKFFMTDKSAEWKEDQ